MLRVTTPDGGYAIWNMSHTINFYDAHGNNYDVATFFGNDGRTPSQVTVIDIILSRMDDMDACQHLAMDDCGRTCHHLECPDCGLLIDTPDVYPVDGTELSLCADCIYMDANGTLPDDAEPDAQPLTKLVGWLISPNETDHICEGHFGYGCDGCDTRLAGSRYCYVGTEE